MISTLSTMAEERLISAVTDTPLIYLTPIDQYLIDQSDFFPLLLLTCINPHTDLKLTGQKFGRAKRWVFFPVT